MNYSKVIRILIVAISLPSVHVKANFLTRLSEKWSTREKICLGAGAVAIAGILIWHFSSKRSDRPAADTKPNNEIDDVKERTKESNNKDVVPVEVNSISLKNEPPLPEQEKTAEVVNKLKDIASEETNNISLKKELLKDPLLKKVITLPSVVQQKIRTMVSDKLTLTSKEKDPYKARQVFRFVNSHHTELIPAVTKGKNSSIAELSRKKEYERTQASLSRTREARDCRLAKYYWGQAVDPEDGDIERRRRRSQARNQLLADPYKWPSGLILREKSESLYSFSNKKLDGKSTLYCKENLTPLQLVYIKSLCDYLCRINSGLKKYIVYEKKRLKEDKFAFSWYLPIPVTKKEYEIHCSLPAFVRSNLEWNYALYHQDTRKWVRTTG